MSSVAPDGSPIEVYKRLPALGEPELVAAVVPEGATILELGCGAERITRPLVALGYVLLASHFVNDPDQERRRELLRVCGRHVDAGGVVWRQPFEAELLDDDALRDDLEASGLTFDRWLDRERGWIVACAR
jgi:hypothetical protein